MRRNGKGGKRKPQEKGNTKGSGSRRGDKDKVITEKLSPGCGVWKVWKGEAR
jgi:hypothetical protein